MTLNDKIKDSIQKITGLRCFEGEPGDAVNGRFAFFMQLQSRARYNEVAVFFVERPMASPIDGRIAIDSCNQLAIKWLNGLYAYSGLKFQEVISQNPVRDNQGGFGVGYRVVLVDAGQNQGVKLDLVTLTLTCDPLSTATLSGAKRYLKNATAKAAATPKYGWVFSKWTNGVEDVSTDNPYEFTIGADTNLIANLTRQKFTVALQGDAGVTGTTGAGSYDYEANCTATATIDSHYDFVSWKIGQTVVSTSNPYTFQVLGATTLNAVTSPKSYDVLAVTNDPTMGTVSGGGTYTYGDTVELAATPLGVYEFQNWTVDGGVVSTANPYTFTASSNVTVQGNFAPPVRVVTTVVSPQGGGTVTGGGSYNYGATCTLTATAASGYLFKSWTVGGNVVSTLSTYTFPVTADVTVTANFMEDSYFYVENTTDQAQSINFNYENMDMDQNSSTVYYSTDKTNWTAANISYQMEWGEEEPTVTFNFDPIPVPANSRVYMKCNGGLWHSQVWYDEGEQKWNDMRNGGFYFVITFPSKIGGNLISMYKNTVHGVIEPVGYNSSEYTITGDHHPFTDMFLNCTGITDASDLILPEGSTWGTYASMFSQCTGLVYPPTRIPGGSFMREHLRGMFYRCTSLVEVPQLGNYTLDNSIVTWSNSQERFEYMFEFCTSLTDSTGITILDSPNYTDYDLTSIFTYAPITSITCLFNSWPANLVTGHWLGYSANVHPNDTMLNFYCKASLPDIVSSDNNTWSKIPPSATRTVLPSYTVSVTVDPQGGGTVTGSGQYVSRDYCNLVATPNENYAFDHWEDSDGATLSTSSTYSFAVSQDVTVKAVFRFEPKWFTVTALDDGFTMTMNKPSGVANDPLEYSKDLTNWTTYTNGTTISLDTDQSVYFRNRGGTYRGQGVYWGGNFAYSGYSCRQTSSGKSYKVSGRLATLFDPDESGDYTAYYVSLFSGETGLVDASRLVMDGVNKMYDDSAMYRQMFYGCTALVHGPKYIPQPRVVGTGQKTYQLAFSSMFQNCTSLVDMPSMDNVSIPITVNIYRNHIFEYMFSGCTSIDDASDFIVPVSSFTSNATNNSGSTLYDGHFRNMFYGCTSLVHGPTIGTKHSFFNISTITNTSYIVAAAPFASCFFGCSNLQDVTLNFDYMINAWSPHNSSYNSSRREWNTSYAFHNWLGNVAAQGTVYSISTINPTGSTSNLPTGWTNTIIS